MKEQNKMATMPVGKLMLNMGIPIILSMMLQAVYNIVDSYFVSNIKDTAEMTGVGEAAVNALTLAFPVQMLIVLAGIIYVVFLGDRGTLRDCYEGSFHQLLICRCQYCVSGNLPGVRLWFRNIDFISVTSADISASGGMDFSKGR